MLRLSRIFSAGLRLFLFRVELILLSELSAATSKHLANRHILPKLNPPTKILRLATENKILRRLKLKENTSIGAVDKLYRQNYQFRFFLRFFCRLPEIRRVKQVCQAE